MKISTLRLVLLAIVLLGLTPITQGQEQWPLKLNIDLSSGFGDFRPNRYHAGVDLRTNGNNGADVVSPVDGWVYRVKMSYTGYGKGLYIMGDDDHIYVFAHLNAFGGLLNRWVMDHQREIQRYYFDYYFPKDSIRVEKGKLIAYSGQTGIGAPHLHFEKRNGENMPVNPLTNGFKLSDNVKPIFKSIGFKLVDDMSLLANGRREMNLDVSFKSKGKYKLDSTLYFHRPFVINTEVFDMMRSDGMIQSVYDLKLYVDDKLYYEALFDSLNFDRQRSVNFEYEYEQAVVHKNKKVRRLYSQAGNSYPGSSSPNKTAGIISDATLSTGHHRGKIVARDCFNNKSILSFDFIYGPDEHIFTLDSMVKEEKNHYFYFTPTTSIKPLKLDSAVVKVNKRYMWGVPPGSKVEILPDGRLKCLVVGVGVSTVPLKLVLYSKGCEFDDLVFNGILKKGKSSFGLTYEILEDGLLVNIDGSAIKAAESRIEFYFHDSLLGVEYPRFYNMHKYVCFVPVKKKYARVDKIGYSLSLDSNYAMSYVKDLNLYAVGYETDETISFNQITLHLSKDNFYKPRYIEVRTNSSFETISSDLISGTYSVKPEVFICKKPFPVSIKIRDHDQFNVKCGLSWFNPDNKRWVWLDTKLSEDTLYANSEGGGVFGALIDLEVPKIRRLSIQDQYSYYNNSPGVRFFADDSLSGLGDDLSFIIKLNGEWLIPEFDPESKQLRTKPNSPLEPGKHHLGIEVIDRAGNKFEQYLNFYVKKKKGRK